MVYLSPRANKAPVDLLLQGFFVYNGLECN